MASEPTSTQTKHAFWDVKNTGFVPATPECDFLHPDSRQAEPGVELTETQYLGFNIPEHRIHALCYMWHHPNLGVVTGGAWVWQGLKRNQLQCELFDILTYVDDGCLAGDLHDYQLPNSYHVEVLEPLKRLRIRYDDPQRENAFDIEFEGMMEPMVLASGMHLEQGMKARGALTLRGESYAVDGYTVRDRSWGQLRKENHVPVPSMAWMTCVFDDSFAFGTTAFDAEETDPEWKGIMEIPGGDPTRGGWVYRDGELVPVVSAVKRTRRDFDTMLAEAVEMTITDATGRAYEIRGTIIAAAPWHTWHNFETVIALVRWECNGRVGHGDYQDVLFNDYVHRFQTPLPDRT